jgi:AAA15 family ATPase/GTPase
VIISFSLENWLSFRDKVTFSMLATKERRHSERLAKLQKYRAKVLPIAAIYGGNASGKTNFFKALNFVKHMVVNGTQPGAPIHVKPFKLDSTGSEQPSKFCFELLINEIIYEFSFSVTRKAVVEEKLIEITGTKEKVLYHRSEGNINFDGSAKKDDFLLFAFKGTRDNQLFLTNSVSQNVKSFLPVYDWFKDSLVLVAPDSRFGQFTLFIDESSPLYSTMNELLVQLDTGIAHLGSDEFPLDSILFPNSLKSVLQENETTSIIENQSSGDMLLITPKDGDLVAKKLVTFHSKADGEEVKFEVNQESDGSRRLLDLLPAFLEMSSDNSNKVYVIDELDRSLHTLLTRRLLELYLAACSNGTRKQMLFTTHDVLLMDQELLRRDEMWVTERDNKGNSSLFSFSEYKDIRYDKDIRKSYLQGRLGGIPRIFLGDILTNPYPADKNEATPNAQNT